MPVETEQTTSTVEAITAEPSAEAVNVSDDKETELEAETDETPKAEKEVVKPAAKEEPLDPKLEARIQSEADKRTAKYQATREADAALMRKQAEELRTLKLSTKSRTSDPLIKGILSEDEDKGLTPEQTLSREQALKKFVDTYDKNYAEVEEAAQVVAEMATKIPPHIVKQFSLNDPNPVIRARNGVELLSSAAEAHQHNQNFLMAVEQFFPKGDEVRKQIEEIVDALADPELSTEKAKKLYLADRMKGLKPTPKKKPPVPSGVSGGNDLSKLSGRELMARGYEKELRGGK